MMLIFTKKVGKTFFSYGFTVEKRFNEEIKELYGLSLGNLQCSAELFFLSERHSVTIRLADQNRSKTRKLRPSALKPREVIQISYQSNQQLRQSFAKTFSQTYRRIGRGKKPEISEFAQFRINEDGTILCIPNLSGLESTD